MKHIPKESGPTRVQQRAIELLGTMSETQVLHRLAAEGWLVDPTVLRKWRLAAGIAAWKRPSRRMEEET